MNSAHEYISKAICELEDELGANEAFPLTLQLMRVLQQLTERERDQPRNVVSIADRRQDGE